MPGCGDSGRPGVRAANRPGAGCVGSGPNRRLLDAPDLISQRKIAGDLQAEALGLVLYVPGGQYLYRTACRRDITGIISGQFVFWDVQRA
jgi:hypothetical protein